ncbi:potassium uptake system protein [Anoxybacter fermentans]|uniref:Potassium uptake system protein n=1 Tax=Anoxybacter fermentans TaxID=1323375 RepID=A0A3S9SZ93_9FIRM|nr:TrkA family potassium uptake protein [Anoxybacter fermentans]AZR73673.1 potassium uptake system protein [Anoxybacter fermentans]
MKQFVVIGLGRFGSSVARTLCQKGFDVLAIDIDEERVQALADEVTHAVQADATDEEAMKSLGIRNFDIAIISIGTDIHSNILTTLLVKELGVKYVVVKAQTELHGKVLTKIGADKVVYPERDMGVRVANSLISSNVLDLIEVSPEYTIAEVTASPKLYGHTLSDLQFRTRFGVNVIAIKNGDKINVTPRATDEIKKGDILIVIGENENLERLRKY